jgi:hypothetical protein
MRDDLALDLEQISDAEARRVIGVLLNLIETQAGQLVTLKAENQGLRNEVNRLKGEQGQPTFRANKRRPSGDHSSEQERRAAPTAWHKAAKLAHLAVDRTQEQVLDRSTLPADAVFKGYAELVVQDVVLRTETIRFRCERWYSPSAHRTYQAPLPPGYHGQFGPGMTALALYLTYETNVSQAKLLALFGSVGLVVSAGHLAGVLTEQPGLQAEYRAIGRAGLGSATYQHVDETPTPLAGVTAHCHILATPAYTSYRTTPGLDRQAVLDVLRLGGPRRFCLNAFAWAFLDQGRLAQRTRRALLALPQGVEHDAATFTALLDPIVPATYPALRRLVLEAAAIGAYRVQHEVPVVDTLVGDGASAWEALTAHLGLCWVHEGRHYKKLLPTIPHHRQLLETVRQDFWAYYRDLLAYQAQPTAADAARLGLAFDTLFGQVTGYDALDGCLRRTLARKTGLLLVLEQPDLPLHNNPAELAARRRVRKRDASFGARSQDGIATWDTLQTIFATASKLGVNAWHYLQDRCAQTNAMPSLASLIPQLAASAAAPT